MTITKPSKQKKDSQYFSSETQLAIMRYNIIEDREDKSRLYVEHIQPAFVELIDKIVYTYKFHQLNNLPSLKEDCFIYLISILSKFDPSKGSKAFSYFTVITKNWFTYKAKLETKRKMEEVEISQVYEKDHIHNIMVDNPYEQDLEKEQFVTALIKIINEWEKEFSPDSESYNIIQAIKILFSNIEDIDIFNRKAIYIYLREITGLDTKQISPILKSLRKKYFDFKNKWDSGKINE